MKEKSDCMKYVVIDDDDIDREVIRRALRKNGSTNPIIEAENGAVALSILQGTADKAPLEKPYLLILDLNMPRMNGFEFLDRLRDDPNLRYTPIFVLSTSGAESDKKNAHKRCISGYILKSSDNQDLTNAVAMLDQYQRIVELPT